MGGDNKYRSGLSGGAGMEWWARTPGEGVQKGTGWGQEDSAPKHWFVKSEIKATGVLVRTPAFSLCQNLPLESWLHTPNTSQPRVG